MGRSHLYERAQRLDAPVRREINRIIIGGVVRHRSLHPRHVAAMPCHTLESLRPIHTWSLHGLPLSV